MSPTTWQPPERMPSRTELRPPPADLAALVRAGHLHQVEPGVYRRASSNVVLSLATWAEVVAGDLLDDPAKMLRRLADALDGTR